MRNDLPYISELLKGLQLYLLHIISFLGLIALFLSFNQYVGMENLHEILKIEKYKKIKFKITKTQHLLIKAKINGYSGNFILDTGASNTCVGFESIERFELAAKNSKTKASGAGGTGMATQISSQNKLQLGSWKSKDFSIVIFDLSHVNEALESYKAKPVHGIIGADVLLQGKAIIDYFNHYLYLK